MPSHPMSTEAVIERRRCEACGAVVVVRWSDGVPMRSDEVHTMFPLGGGDPLILHACDDGADVSPVLLLQSAAADAKEEQP